MPKDKNIQLYSATDFERYWKGELSSEEMRLMEKAAQEDPFLADALEGYRNTSSPAGDIKILRKNLAERTDVHPGAGHISGSGQGWWKLAAGVAGLAGIGFLAVKLFLNTENSPSNIASVENLQPDTLISTQDQSENVPDGNVQSLASDSLVSNPDRNIVGTIPEKPTERSVKPSSKQQDAASISGITKKEPGPEENVSALNQGEIVSSGRAAAPVIQSIPEINKPKQDSLVASGNAAISESADSGAEMKSVDVISANGRMLQKVKTENYKIYSLPGRVTDVYDNNIPYAQITNLSNQATAQTGTTGIFAIPVGNDTLVLLEVSAPGYTTREFRLNRYDRNDAVLVLMENNDEPEQGGDISVTADLYESRLPGNINKVFPEPENGWALYNEYLQTALKQKNAELRTGMVMLSFRINNSGRPSLIKVIKSLSMGCDDLAVELLKNGPRWIQKGSSKEATIMFRFH